jgi:tetratricopeptide (TPR) repeat protein
MLDRGDTTGALAYFDRCIELDPANVGALYNKAYIAMEFGLYDSALTWLKMVQALDPWSYETLLNLGVCCERTGRLAQAEAFYSDAISVDFRRPEAYDNLSLLYLGSRRYDEATDTTIRWREVEPNGTCDYRLAVVAARTGDVEAAVQRLLAAFSSGYHDLDSVRLEPAFVPVLEFQPGLLGQLERMCKP